MSPHAAPPRGSLPPEGADPAWGGPAPDRFNSPVPLTAWITGVGFIAPGLPDWPSARAVLRGEQAWLSAPSLLPAPAILPPAERRRASRVIKLTLGIGLEAAAGADVSTLATVFSSSGSDGHNCHALCEQLATDDRHVSPTRFHNSVHNAPAGYWGIATKSMAPSQVMCAFDGSFCAGLLDALGQVVLDQQATLLLAYDSEYPEPLRAKRPVPDCAGVALRLEHTRSARALARITVQTTEAPASPWGHAALEPLRSAIPALRALPLLERLAQGEAGEVCLDYLPGLQLAVRVEPVGAGRAGMSAAPGRSQASSHRSPQGEGIPVSAAPGRSQASSHRSPQGEGPPVSNPALDHAWIAARIPHQGNMCLLDAVTDWSADHVVCRAVGHTDPAHPLREAGRLGAANGIEYAAQAMAVHGALVAGANDAPRQGYLTSVRGVTLHVQRLDDLPGPLSVRAERVSGDASNVLYRFTLHHGERCLLEGRAAVVLDADAR